MNFIEAWQTYHQHLHTWRQEPKATIVARVTDAVHQTKRFPWLATLAWMILTAFISSGLVIVSITILETWPMSGFIFGGLVIVVSVIWACVYLTEFYGK